MAEFEIEYPKGSGELYDITAPDDATDAQIEKAFFEFLSDERGIGDEALRKAEFGARGFVDAVTDTAAAIPEMAAAIREASILLQVQTSPSRRPDTTASNCGEVYLRLPVRWVCRSIKWLQKLWQDQ